MKVYIREVDEHVELAIIDPKSGVNWIQDLLGNASAFEDEQFVYNEDSGEYTCSVDTYNWWAKYIADYEQTERDIAQLADELNLTRDDIIEYMCRFVSFDYEYHRAEALSSLADIREAGGIPT